MFPVETMISFFTASLLLAAAPGPDNIFVLTQSALQGPRAGFMVTAGLCTGLMAQTSAVALGLAAVFHTSAIAYMTLRLIGACYLLFLAFQSLRSSAAGPVMGKGKYIPIFRLYTRGIIMNITNPKVSIFFLAFLPLFAGLAGRKERLIEALTDPSRFWTAFGISSVDMAAPSFNPDGYWNGAVWPVMQWFIWRGLLEAGEPALARRLAEAILTTWQNAFVRDRYLGEHFVLKNARMSGAPNFGGLSAVLLPMHAAYYTPYQVTPLYDVAIRACRVDEEADRIELTLSAPYLEAAEHDLLVNMGRARAEYRVIRNGAPWRVCRSDEFGHLCLRLPRPDAEDSIRIEP